MQQTPITIDESSFNFALELSTYYDDASYQELISLIEKHFSAETNTPSGSIFRLSDKQKIAMAQSFSQPTPTTYELAPKVKHDPFAMLQLVMSAKYGQPFALADQRNGSLIHDIFPMEKNRNRPNSSLGSKERFNFHTDQAYNPDRTQAPTWVSLSCIRNNERAVLRVASVESAITAISETAKETLHEELFVFHKGRPEENLDQCMGAVLSTDGDSVKIRVGTDMTFLHDDAKRAIEELLLALDIHGKCIELQSGDIAIINNRSNVHGRNPFEPASNPDQRRWVQRLHIGRSL